MANLGRSKILIVDDHPIVRLGLAQVINREQDMEVCGEAATVPEAMHQIEAQCPDVVIVDISLEGENGIELIEHIQARWPRVKMLVSSAHDERVFAGRVLRAGALGYLSKREAIAKIVEAIRRVLQRRGLPGRRHGEQSVTARRRRESAGRRPHSDPFQPRTSGLRADRQRTQHTPNRPTTGHESEDHRIASPGHQDEAECRDQRPTEPDRLPVGPGEPSKPAFSPPGRVPSGSPWCDAFCMTSRERQVTGRDTAGPVTGAWSSGTGPAPVPNAWRSRSNCSMALAAAGRSFAQPSLSRRSRAANERFRAEIDRGPLQPMCRPGDGDSVALLQAGLHLRQLHARFLKEEIHHPAKQVLLTGHTGQGLGQVETVVRWWSIAGRSPAAESTSGAGSRIGDGSVLSASDSTSAISSSASIGLLR